MKLHVIKYKDFWIGFSSLLLVLSITALFVFGLKPSIEFTGGSLLEFQTQEEQEINALREVFQSLNKEGFVQASGDKRYVLRTQELTQEEHEVVLQELTTRFGAIEELRFESIGPTIGKELQKKSFIAVVLLLGAIIAYIAWSFRLVTGPVTSWKYGILTIMTAIHDVLIPLGAFAVFGHVFGYQIDIAFIAAILTILGYSINDTIVVFDRTRENILRQRHVSHEEFADIVDKSINQSAMRSINTSFTTLLALFTVFFFGGETLKPFALALIIGITAGAYSSIFVASPLLVFWQKKNKE